MATVPPARARWNGFRCWRTPGSIQRVDIDQALRARLAAAGLQPPSDERQLRQLQRDLALHLARIATLAEAGEQLGPDDPPHTDPTRAAGPA
jgi:hypothetical protein